LFVVEMQQVPLVRGSRLGHYEIISWLGGGGMGEVYRARDSRLDRVVAIKVLRPEIAGDADSRRRFEREARAVSSLNHPHICALHDVGHENGIDFLVLEHLEGESLSDRLKRGALPLEEGISIAVQIVAALDGAHRCGVIHRDLKPGNVMLTRHGAKLLDFGLARSKHVMAVISEDPSGTPLGSSAETLTVEASVLGTVPYMSPEQIEGRDVDARSDIFSAGIVIYEMITGRRPFDGSSSAAVMAAILNSEPPPMSGTHANVPRALDRLVRQCLAKNRDDRVQSAHDVGLNLRWIHESMTLPEGADTRDARTSRRVRFEWIAATVGLVALVAAVLSMWAPRATPPQDVIRFSIVPEGARLDEPYWSHPSISPDGRAVAYVARSEGKNGLWLRPLDEVAARPLPGTVGALAPFWSPDSRFIAFFSENSLKAVAPAGGAPRSICDIPSVASTGTWGSTGTIVLQINEAPGQDGLYRVSASGGGPTRIKLRDASGNELVETSFPHFLPDGRLLVGGRTADEEWGGYLASLDSEKCERIRWESPVVSRVEYASPGYLLGVGGSTLYAQRFDARAGRFRGSPVAIAEDILEYGGGARFSVSSNGVLVYGPGGGVPSRLTWFDRSGRTLGSVGAPAIQEAIALSPDERRLAVGMEDLRTRSVQIWVFKLPDGIPTRMTSERASVEFFPVWSPDGREIAYSSSMEAPPNLFRRRLDGSDSEVLVPSNGHAQWASDWSQDGRSILYNDRDPKTGSDLWVLPMDGDRKARPWLQSPFNEGDAQFSRDGKWVAYASDESGRYEIYLRSFRGTEERRRVSSAGGRNPRWRGDGREIFYLDLGAEPALVSVPLDPSTIEPVGTAQPLFRSSTSVLDFDVTRDGQRFLVNHDVGAKSLIHVVVNWTTAVR
jgi:eukaryotic-like serine/threonine-protein kinase